MTKKCIRLALSQPALAGAIEEQFALLPDFHIVSEDADLTISDEASADGTTLVLGRSGTLAFPVRLGAVVDQARYLLSGRERLAAAGVGTLELGPFLLHAEESQLVHKQSGEVVRLTDKERLFLLTLYESPDRSLDRRSLLEDVWGYAKDTETHTLETHLYRLRQKLEIHGASDLIASEGGLYRLKI